MEYKGNYNNELKSYFERVLKTLYPNGKYVWANQDEVRMITYELTQDQIVEMFPDLWDIDYENWSEHYISLEDNNQEVLNIGLYRESKDDAESTHSIEYFIGGDLANNEYGQMIDCISFNLKEN